MVTRRWRELLALKEANGQFGLSRLSCCVPLVPLQFRDVARPRNPTRSVRDRLTYRCWPGEVYGARDTKLDREVAIKVLPEEFAADEERLARFEREAKLLASLNHPNIASIHGFEESDGFRALVLELIEGPTLAERIEEGPVPVDEALGIARQIAEALEAGHEVGVIHRDLKPANIKLREDGTVKVLDYGLAKALEGDAQSGGDSELSQSPTAHSARHTNWCHSRYRRVHEPGAGQRQARGTSH